MSVAHMKPEDEPLTLFADTDEARDRLLHVIAQVMVWESGTDPDKIADEARRVIWQDYALQCAQDLGLVK